MNDCFVAIKCDASLYMAWQTYLKRRGVQTSGRYSGIHEMNKKIFEAELRRIMEEK